MITYEDATWTDSPETYEYFGKFQAKHGHDIARPACQRCDRMTCYIVEETTSVREFTEGGTKMDSRERKMRGVKFKRPGLNLLVQIMRPAYFLEDGLAFIVVSECMKCTAQRSGFDCGANEPEQKDHILGRLARLPMTAEERSEYTKIFNAAFIKGAFSKKPTEKKDAARYTPKQGATA